MGLYFCLTDAEGSYEFEIELIYLNTEQVIVTAKLPTVEIKDRLQIHDYGVTLPTIAFPEPGRYEFRLRADGRFIAQKDFTVIQVSS